MKKRSGFKIIIALVLAFMMVLPAVAPANPVYAGGRVSPQTSDYVFALPQLGEHTTGVEFELRDLVPHIQSGTDQWATFGYLCTLRDDGLRQDIAEFVLVEITPDSSNLLLITFGRVEGVVKQDVVAIVDYMDWHLLRIEVTPDMKTQEYYFSGDLVKTYVFDGTSQKPPRLFKMGCEWQFYDDSTYYSNAWAAGKAINARVEGEWQQFHSIDWFMIGVIDRDNEAFMIADWVGTTYIFLSVVGDRL